MNEFRKQQQRVRETMREMERKRERESERERKWEMKWKSEVSSLKLMLLELRLMHFKFSKNEIPLISSFTKILF